MSNEKRPPMRPGGMGHGPGRFSGEKAKDFGGTIRKLIRYMSRYKVSVILVLIFAVGGVLLNIYGPKVLMKANGAIVDGVMEMVSGVPGGGIDFVYVGKILLILLGMYLLSSGLTVVQGFLMTGVSQKVSFNLRREISQKISRLPMKYFDTKTHGEVLSRVTNDVDTLSQSLNQSITQLITSVTQVIGVLVMMLTISWELTLAALCILPVSMLCISFIIKHSQKFFKSQQEYLGHINGQVEEVYSGHNIVQAFNHEEKTVERFAETNEILYKSAWKSQFLSGMMQPMMQFIGNLGYVVVSVLGGWLVIRGRIGVEAIVSFVQYVRMFTQPFSQVAQVANMLQSTAAASERVFEFLEETEEDVTVENPVSPEGLEGRVDFEHVSFGYNPDKIIIHDFTAHVKPGQKIAIVGPTGAGKTTMVKLLMRFYDVNSGAILVDGHDIRDFNRGELRQMFGMVLQDTWLFEGTVRENLVYNKTGVTDEQLENACRACGIYHFIETLPKGFDTVLDESIAISAGQKQLLTIARAMIQDNPMLILDEATSSVDTRTELITQRAMDALTSKRTSFVIAHRLSTIRNADLILVLKDGDIIEQGTHDELIAKGGFYADLYMSQFEKTA